MPLLAAAGRKANMAAALREGLDYKEYFLSAAKETALASSATWTAKPPRTRRDG